VCTQLSEIGVELGFILDDLLSSDLNKLIQQAGDNQMDAVRHRAAVSNGGSDSSSATPCRRKLYQQQQMDAV